MKSTFTIIAASATLAFSSAAFANTAEDTIAANKCSSCHTANTTKKAPSWASIAEKYKGNPEAASRMVTMLKTGGKTPDGDDHKKVAASDADLQAIVQIVLGSK